MTATTAPVGTFREEARQEMLNELVSLHRRHVLQRGRESIVVDEVLAALRWAVHELGPVADLRRRGRPRGKE